MKFSTILLSALTFLSAGSAMAVSAPENNWQSVNGKWSGDWNDPDHWSLGHVPTTDETACLAQEGGDFSITVTNVCQVGWLDVVAKGGSVQTVTLTGSGTLDLRGAHGGGNNAIRSGRALVLDGVSLKGSVAADSLIYGTLTVRSGAVFKNTRHLKMYQGMPRIVVDGGSVELNALQYVATASGSALVLNGGSVTCKQIVGNKDDENPGCPFAVEVNGGEMTVESFSLTRTDSTLSLNGGVLTVKTDFTLGDGVRMNMTDGILDLKPTDASKVVIAANAGLVLSGGLIDFYFAQTDARFFQTDGTGVNLNGNSLKPAAVALAGGELRAKNIYNIAPGLSLDYRRLVFQGGKEPFFIEDKTVRDVYLNGPMTISTEADMPDTCGVAWHVYCCGDFTVDTCDAKDGETPRNVNFRHVHPRYGACSFDICGGGSLSFLQDGSGDTFSSVAVREGTTLKLLDCTRGSIEYTALQTESFIMEKNAVLTFRATYNFVAAESFAIDPEATIRVVIPDDMIFGAAAVLQSLGSALPEINLNQVVLVDEDGKPDEKGFKVKRENGQVTVYKEGAVSGTYPTEWVGKGANACIAARDNFYSALPTKTVGAYFGADTTRLSSEWGSGQKLEDGGTTIASYNWLDSAVETFTHTANGETMNGKPALASYSGVPQNFNGAIRGQNQHLATYANGPLVFGGSAPTWTRPNATTTWGWYNKGDCRIANAQFAIDRVKFYTLETGAVAAQTSSRLTVLNGSAVTVGYMDADAMDVANACFRVENGGSLTFADTDGTQVFKVKRSTFAKQVIHGTMDIQIPFKGGADQTFGGSGTLKLASTVPDGAASRVRLSDSLTAELANDWDTARSGADYPLAITALRGAPKLKVPDGWRYGTPSDFASASASSVRALEIVRGATLTVDAANGVATIGEAVIGEGRLIAAQGTTLKLSSGNTAGVLVKAGSAFDVSEDLSVGSFEAEAGAVLAFGEGAVLTSAGDVTIGAVSFDFGGESASDWRTVIICTAGVVRGAPSVSDRWRTRVVETADGLAVQVKDRTGLAIIFR